MREGQLQQLHPEYTKETKYDINILKEFPRQVKALLFQGKHSRCQKDNTVDEALSIQTNLSKCL